ncbi:MAG TPA: hypothetical protein IAB48_08840 [Candidatus Fimimorpha excrementavium]|nr:hypothetical protein [Candidatus Fimimorpha excrementavium]
MDKIKIKMDDVETELAVCGGQLEWSEEHYITERSLKWTAKNGDCLRIDRPLAVRERRVLETYQLKGKTVSLKEYGFGFHGFVYSTEPSDQKLIFSFWKQGEKCLSFTYHLNYIGWKEINIPYERGFMKGQYQEGMDRMTVSISTDREGAVVYLDDIQLCRSMSPLHVYGAMCEQVPDLGRHTRRMTACTEEMGGIWLNRPILFKEKITESRKRTFAEMESRYLAICDEMDLPPFESFHAEKQEILDFFDSYHLRETEGRITGKHIQGNTAYIRMMKALAYEYQRQPDEKLADLFILAYRHLKDQNSKVNWYNGRGAASSFLLMKPVLKQRGLLKEVTAYLKYQYGFNKVYDTTSKAGVAGHRFEDSDVTGMDLPSMLACVLLMEDCDEKVQDMRYLVRYMEEFCLGYAPGISSGCKKDGVISHHCGFVRNYQIVAVYSFSRVLEILADTEFMIGETAVSRFRTILETEYKVYQGAYESFALSEYEFNAQKDVSVCEFAHTARALHDEELARMYMRLAETSKREREMPYYKEWKAKGLEPAPLTDVHKTLTSAAAAIHRRGRQIATVRGHSQYVYSMEIWPELGGRYTAFSLYRSFGFLELAEYPQGDSGLQNGVMIDRGFDYRRWNGATAVCLPYDQIKSAPLDVDDERAEWLMSDQPFVGGLDDSRQNGIFVLKLHGHQKYGMESFYASKSYHFYDDVIVCLGSGINSDYENYDTETTLFQDYGSGAVREGNILADNRDNGYYVWDASQLEFFEKDVVSRDMKDHEDTHGHRAFALLNHGKQPKDASYAYLIGMKKGIDGIRVLSVEENIRILRQDKYAHIVQIFDKRDYVLFRKDYELHDRYIDSVTESCLLSLTHGEDGSIHLSVCDPDLRYYHGESEDYDLNRVQREQAVYGRFWMYNESHPSLIWVVFNGKVQALQTVSGKAARIVQQSQTKTILEFECCDGFTNEVKFKLKDDTAEQMQSTVKK